MADTQTQTDPKQQQSDPQQQNDGSDDKEKSYWDKLGQVIDDKIEAAFKKREPTGTSRNSGTNPRGIPQIVADFMFGPDKKD